VIVLDFAFGSRQMGFDLSQWKWIIPFVFKNRDNNSLDAKTQGNPSYECVIIHDACITIH